jgi:uncharacterized membrane protein
MLPTNWRLLTRRGLLRAIDQARVEAAIAAAELRTSGEIRVSVARYFWGDVQKVADLAFVRLGMTATAQRNAVLFFVVPSRRRFAVIGDSGIHAKVGPQFWLDVAGVLTAHFRDADFTGGLVAGIGAVGERLAHHFPYDGTTDRNELPDGLDFGSRR